MTIVSAAHLTAARLIWWGGEDEAFDREGLNCGTGQPEPTRVTASGLLIEAPACGDVRHATRRGRP
ncbi:hypothetical protein [Verrucosispora sp. WMMD573]|uniref:hypothetical protein n=1 Tax=Verrucosispora sp. WMMD573 TaxID=3015149 RepID=UPI00248CD505|nr:hypothetical protein [Verrucosispora sp. WMMD573]WBB55638.1 hypothetical protein O7601_05905 [Verrucosispora sp. WMMD573]